MPLVRDLALAEPDEPGALGHDDEYLLGPDLLVAPVLDPGARERDVYLPPGRWIDLWRSARYRERRGDLALGRAAVLGGGRTATVPAPLDELPLLVRAGAAVAMLDPAVDSLAGYADAATASSRSASAGGGCGSSPSRAGAASPLRERRAVALGGAARAMAASDRRQAPADVPLQASFAAMRRPFMPCAVTARGERVPPSQWSWDGAAASCGRGSPAANRARRQRMR